MNPATLSGRELDAAVATQIFDLPFREVGEEYPIYSTDDALALQAADKAGVFHCEYTLLWDCLTDETPFLWIVASKEAIYNEIEGSDHTLDYFAIGTTRAEALCRAALILAMEKKS